MKTFLHSALLLAIAFALFLPAVADAAPCGNCKNCPHAAQCAKKNDGMIHLKPPFGRIVACRMANYGADRTAESSFEHVAKAGFKYVFMNIIPPSEIDATKAKLAKYGLKVAVFRGDTDLSRESSVDELAEQLATCKKMGVKYMFLSPKHKTVSKEVAIERLKKVAPIAQANGVVIGLETHPDLGTNGDEHVKTMKAINHPNIRVNFDCANITFYNKNTDAVKELTKCIDYVGTFEIKDHNGEFKSWHFPALGEGKLDIPAVLKMLKDHGYRGPITLEIEGIKGVPRSKEQVKKDIEVSEDYIRDLLEELKKK